MCKGNLERTLIIILKQILCIREDFFIPKIALDINADTNSKKHETENKIVHIYHRIEKNTEKENRHPSFRILTRQKSFYR